MPRFHSFAVILIVVPTIVGCSEELVVETVLRPVRYERVSHSTHSQTRTLAGVVRSGVESRLSFRVGGPIESLAIAVGDRVSREQTLARVDPADYELRVEVAKAALAHGNAALRKTVADRERVRALYENNNASKSELDASRAAFESAQAQVDAHTKELEQARRQLTYTSLRAPSDGAVASVRVEVNEYVTAGQEVCLLISDSDPEAVTAVPEAMIGAIEVGQQVTVEIDALREGSFRAEVTEVGVAVTGAATTYAVTARLLDSDHRVRSGMAADITFDLLSGRGIELIVVPAVAVGEDSDGRFVYVIDGEPGSEGVANRRSVTIGRPRETRIEILEGLEPGEIVATAGVRRISDGERVRLLSDDHS